MVSCLFPWIIDALLSGLGSERFICLYLCSSRFTYLDVILAWRWVARKNSTLGVGLVVMTAFASYRRHLVIQIIIPVFR
jgi:hypothetical protein